MMKRILITGATGYIGRFLTNRLLEEGYSLILLTRNKHKILREWATKGCKIYEGDITNYNTLTKIEKEKIDYVFHLAAILNVPDKAENFLKINVEGTKNILNLALKCGVKKFVFASSIEAIGATSLKELPVDETCSPRPTNLYGKSKFEAEKLVNEYHQKYNQKGLKTTIARIGIVYGLDTAFVFPIVKLLLKEAKPAKNNHNFQNENNYYFQKRYIHLIYITDLIEMLVRCLKPIANGKTYFLVGNEYILSNELTELISSFLDEPSKYLIFSSDKKPSKESIHMAYSNKKVIKELGFNPKIKLEEGVKKTIDWLFKKKI